MDCRSFRYTVPLIVKETYKLARHISVRCRYSMHRSTAGFFEEEKFRFAPEMHAFSKKIGTLREKKLAASTKMQAFSKKIGDLREIVLFAISYLLTTDP